MLDRWLATTEREDSVLFEKQMGSQLVATKGRLTKGRSTKSRYGIMCWHVCLFLTLYSTVSFVDDGLFREHIIT